MILSVKSFELKSYLRLQHFYTFYIEESLTAGFCFPYQIKSRKLWPKGIYRQEIYRQLPK